MVKAKVLITIPSSRPYVLRELGAWKDPDDVVGI